MGLGSSARFVFSLEFVTAVKSVLQFFWYLPNPLTSPPPQIFNSPFLRDRPQQVLPFGLLFVAVGSVGRPDTISQLRHFSMRGIGKVSYSDFSLAFSACLAA